MAEGKPVVLFLCSQNACRSQMAEAFLRHYAEDTFEVHSAGLVPADEIHPMACSVMEEVGISLDDQKTEGTDRYLGETAVRYAIFVCEATAEKCPSTWPGMTNRIVWPFEDPARFEGSRDEKLNKFREIRDRIDARIQDWLERIPERAG